MWEDPVTMAPQDPKLPGCRAATGLEGLGARLDRDAMHHATTTVLVGEQRSTAARMSAFPPIADYAFLSDCENSCLVAPDGSVEWLCLPRPDSPSVFGALLDRTAGEFRFGPSSTHVPHQRRYVPGTMVLETTWHTPTGWLVVHDFLVVRPVDEDERRANYRRAPSDAAATGTLVRTASCIAGKVEVVANCMPNFEYGTKAGEWSYDQRRLSVDDRAPSGR